MTLPHLNWLLCDAAGYRRSTITHQNRLDPSAPPVQVYHCGTTQGLTELPNYIDGADALEQLRQLRGTLTTRARREYIQNMIRLCDERYGGEVSPSDVMDPVEITAMLLDEPAVVHALAFALTRELTYWEQAVELLPPKHGSH